MRYRVLGSSDLHVSEISLGSWLTYSGGVEADATRACTDAAFAAGINFFDTANVYGRGAAETAWGEILSGRPRDSYILATKVWGQMSDDPDDRGLSGAQIAKQIDASLARLQTDYVDLYQLHGFDPNTPIDEALEALDTVVRSGKARYVGVSNWMGYRVARALGRSEVKNLARIDSVQPRYNLLFRTFERDLLPLCEEEGVAVIPYNPLAGGLLTGKHDRASKPEQGTRFTVGRAGAMYQTRYWHEREFDTIEELKSVAKDAGMSLTTMAVRWVLSRNRQSAATTTSNARSTAGSAPSRWPGAANGRPLPSAGRYGDTAPAAICWCQRR